MHPARIYNLNNIHYQSGPVLYWMSRDQRISGNWGLHFASEEARKRNVPIIVVFCLTKQFLSARDSHFQFMLEGLFELRVELKKFNIPFVLLQDSADRALAKFINDTGTGMLVTDFDPLLIKQSWQKSVEKQISIPFYEVDSHNIIPCRHVSDKAEYAAYTLRPKINRMLLEFLMEIPELKSLIKEYNIPELDIYLNRTNEFMSGINRIKYPIFVSGEKAAKNTLKEFISNRLGQYSMDRNDPNIDAQSGLSPYLHFGQISAQEVALEVTRLKPNNEKDESLINSIDAFLEELIVRRELSDNFCFYNRDYSNFNGFPKWAQDSLKMHLMDAREYTYSRDEFENAETRDRLWNAAQLEMVYGGKMHGYLRMYWAKKILEWSDSPEEALSTAIYLNNTYELDGRDPNGYAGIAWSIGGVHDRPWFERPVYGKVRYMNYAGCARKFDVEAYISCISEKYRVTIS
jgi:deoxyribodipyrimidine photo-lyase